MIKKFKNYIYKNILTSKNSDKNIAFQKIKAKFDSLEEDTICFQFGDDMVLIADKIINTIERERERIKNKTGFILPLVRCINNSELQENEIDVLINGKKTEERFIIPKEENLQEEITNIINDLYEQHLSEIFSNELVEKYIEKARLNNYKTVTEVCYKLAAVEIKYILIDLLTHNKSIKNISYLFEKISEKIYIYGSYEENIEQFSEILVTSL